MKKRFTKFLAALALLVFMTPTMAGWGQSPYTYTAASGDFGSTAMSAGDKRTKTSNGVTWTLTATQAIGFIGWEGYGNARGIQFGSSSNNAQSFKISTNDIPGTISEIVVNAAMASSSGTKFTVWVGGIQWGDETSVTTTATDYTFTGSGSGLIEVRYTNSKTKKASYFKSIKVTYSGTSTFSVTYNANDGTATPSTIIDNNNNNGYASGDEVTVAANTFTWEGHSFSTWNEAQDGSGTGHAPNSTFNITGNTTLYAQWTLNAHAVTLPAADTYGTYTMNVTNPVAYGTEVALTYTPASGYENYVASWTVNGTAIEGNTFTMPDADVTIGVSVAQYVQPTVIEAGLNNSLFGTSYSGPVSGITDDNPISGTQDNVTITYAGGGNHYVNDNQIRFYPSNKLTFDAPSGYEIKQIVFTADGTWAATISANVGTYTSSTKTWTGSATSVLFTGSGSSRCDMSKATITIGLPPAQYDITYATNLTNGSFATGNPNSAIEGASVSVATTPAVGYRLATMTYNDGTSHDVSVSNNIGSFTMPASDVTVSATFEENVATFTDGVYSEPMTTQASFDNWYAYSKTGDQVWGYYSFYSCARVSGYFSSTNYENEDWFVSPGMLVENGKLQVSFNCAGAYGESTMISAKYSMDYPGYGDPNNYTWTEVSTTPPLPYNESNLNGLESNVVICDIEGLANNTKIYFAFKYTSTNSKAGTFEIKNFTAKQYYTITVGTPENGNIDVVPSDKQVVGGTVSLGATPSENYHFVSWNIEPTVTIEEDAFTMPSANVTVNATFEEDATYTVSYSVNGSIINDFTEPVVYGQFATLWNSEYVDEYATVPTGYTFVGWSTSAGSNETVSSFSPLTDATLYAVLLMDNAPAIYVKVTSLDDITAGTYFIVNAGYVLPNADATSGGPVKSDDYKITIPLSDSYSSLPVAGTEWTFTGTNTAMTIKNSTTGHYLYVNGSNNNGLRVSTTSDTWSFAENGSGFSMEDASNNRYCATYKDGSDWRSYNSATAGNYGDGGVLYLYKLTIPEITYTYIAEIDNTEPLTLSSIEPTYLITVEDGGVLTLEGPNNGTAENLIIEDGGQLICNSSVAATVKKTIAAASKAKDVYGWNTISSPVHTGGNGYVSIGASTTVNLTANEYDMFAYDEANMLWLNQKEQLSAAIPSAGFTVMNNGQGYIYRNSAATDISFVGNTNAGDVTINLTKKSSGDLAGFNLIGNPYPHSIKKGSAQAIDNANLASGFYVLSGGKWLAYTDDEEIVAKQGILVKTSTDDNSLTIKDVPYTAPAGKYHNDNIKFMVSNSRHEDVAYAWFDKGIGLDKISHRDPEAPMLYINQDGKDYAIATMSDDTKAFDLNFRAMTTGTYTLSYKANGNYTYLHVIDRMTGEDVDMLLEGAYSFVGSPKDNENRFIVRLGYMPDYSDDNDEIFAYQSGNDIYVSGQGELQIFDVMGRFVMSERIIGATTISADALSKGVYVLRIAGSEIKTQKIVVR